MAIKYVFNPFTGNVDPIDIGTSGIGNVTNTSGIGTNDAIPTFDVDGTHIKNSLATIQSGGAIETSGFMTSRSVTTGMVIHDGFSWIAPSIELELTGSIELEPNGELIIV